MTTEIEPGETPQTGENVETPTTPTPEFTPETTPEIGEQKSGFDKRISELTRKRREAEREAAYWRGRAEATPTTPVSPTPSQPPIGDMELDPNDFNSDTDYLKAVAKKVAADTQAAVRREMSTETKPSVTPIIQAAREKYDDFDDVAFDPSLPVTQEMYDASVGDNLGDILYHLGKNPKEAQRISRLAPVQQMKEIGKLEAILTLKPSKKQTNAPVPPVVVSGNSSPPRKAEADMNRKELYATWEAQRRKEHGLK